MHTYELSGVYGTVHIPETESRLASVFLRDIDPTVWLGLILSILVPLWKLGDLSLDVCLIILIPDPSSPALACLRRPWILAGPYLREQLKTLLHERTGDFNANRRVTDCSSGGSARYVLPKQHWISLRSFTVSCLVPPLPSFPAR